MNKENQSDLKTNKKEVTCIKQFFKNADGDRQYIQFNGRWIIENEPNGENVISVAITENNQFFILHFVDEGAYYSVFSTWEELIVFESYYSDTILDVIWEEIQESQLKVLDI